jgi:hypothetical protein
MIKNKYYIGQRVRIIEKGYDFYIESMGIREGFERKICYTASHLPQFYTEDDLEPLPEKKKIVLWQWIIKYDDDFLYEQWGCENLYSANAGFVKTGATKEVELT